jgi:tRNA nucleotidyltransferase/poly(A) polymerase
MVHLAAIAEAGHRLVLVGGAIRDTLLGRQPADVDLVVEGDLAPALDAIAAARGRRPAGIGDDFQQTHRFRWAGLSVDIAQALGSLTEDLGRRDFTMNTLAVRMPLHGDARSALIDHHGGIDDLERRRIRPVSAATIASDPLRIMRGVRYVGDLADFALDASDLAILRANTAGLESVAPERIAAEWQAILASPGWVRALDLAWETGFGATTLGARRTRTAVLAWAGAEAASDEAGTRAGVAEPGTAHLVGRLAACFLDLAGPEDPDALIAAMTARRWPRRLVTTAARAACWADLRAADEAELARLALSDPAAAVAAGKLARTVGAAATTQLEVLGQRAVEPRWVTGDDLQRFGLAPGPVMGTCLAEAARQQVLRRWPDRAGGQAWAAARVAELT